MDIDTYDDHPNFSVIVPQPCNAHCEFCSNADVAEDDGKWLDGLRRAIAVLPSKFRSVSITGGEPTLYGRLEETMFVLRKRFEKVVVSTNGVRLGGMEFILKFANAINLSWHGATEKEALAVFGDDEMKAPDPNAIEFLRGVGTGVTLTWVVTEKRSKTDFKALEVRDYVALAEDMGCSAAAFRYDMRAIDGLAGDWIPSLAKSFLPVWDGGCPSCHTWRYERRRFPVFFKASVIDPTEVMRESYEVIYTSRGVLSYDWAGTRPVIEEDEMTKKDKDRLDRIEAAIARLTKAVLMEEDAEVERRPVRCRDSGGGGSCSRGGGGRC